MSITIVGELTADEQTIILIGAGPPRELAPAARALGWLTPSITPTDPPGALALAASWPAVVQLSHTFGPVWAPGPRLRAWTSAQAQRRAAASGLSAGGLTVDPPPHRVPRGYQVTGALMLGHNGSALLFDEPGTGKTVTTVLGLIERAAAGHPVTPVIVISPLSVIDAWIEHVRDWSGGRWDAAAWHGAERRLLLDRAGVEVYVTSYATARQDAGAGGPLLTLGARTVVADECHLIKNPGSKQTRSVLRLAEQAAELGGGFVGLSGTPITHNPADLWPALHALDPRAWPDWGRWIERYCEQFWGNGIRQIGGLAPAREAEFRVGLLGAHRRVAKADVLAELPPKIYTTRLVELPTKWRREYDRMEQAAEARLVDSDGVPRKLSVLHRQAVLTRLMQFASSPFRLEATGELDPDGVERMAVWLHASAGDPSWKVSELLAVMGERPGEPVVCFAPSKQLMRLAGAAATAAGYRVGWVIGGQPKAERDEWVRRFQDGVLDLICVTTGAGGVGLTLTRSRTCVFLQRPWSLVEAVQAEDRLHRIGAEHDAIEVIDVVARDTIDSRVRLVLKERAGQLAELVQDDRVVAGLFGGQVRVK